MDSHNSSTLTVKWDADVSSDFDKDAQIAELAHLLAKEQKRNQSLEEMVTILKSRGSFKSKRTSSDSQLRPISGRSVRPVSAFSTASLNSSVMESKKQMRRQVSAHRALSGSMSCNAVKLPLLDVAMTAQRALSQASLAQTSARLALGLKPKLKKQHSSRPSTPAPLKIQDRAHAYVSAILPKANLEHLEDRYGGGEPSRPRTVSAEQSRPRTAAEVRFDKDLERQWMWECQHNPFFQQSSSLGRHSVKFESPEVEAQNWARSTLSSVPSAADEFSTSRKMTDTDSQKDEAEADAGVDATGEPTGADESPKASHGEDDGENSKDESDSPKSSRGSDDRPPKDPNRDPLADRMDAFYGFPDLAERMDQVNKTMFGSGEIMDETLLQRLKSTFNRFRSGGGNEISKHDLPDIVQLLGYVMISEEHLESVVTSITQYDEMDFTEFLDFVEKYAKSQFEHYREMFNKFDEDGSGDIAVDELRKLLTNIGFVVVRQMIEEALDIVDDGNGELSFEEFIMFLTVYNHCEGFTQEQVKQMYQVYDGFVQESTKITKGAKGLQAKDLADALVAIFGLQSEHHAQRFGKRLASGANQDPGNGLNFPDFCIYCRRLREADLVDYKDVFRRFDADGSGNIDAEELADVLSSLGYKPMRTVIFEVLAEVDFEADCELDFEEFCHFMMVFRQRDGFTKRELDQYKLVFNKFDDGDEAISTHELGDMLRYLGFSVAADDLHALVAEVDVNRNGTLDCNEWLRLMRLQRESELRRLQSVFDYFSGGQEMLPVKSFFSAVQDSLKEGAAAEHVEKAIAGKTEACDFEAFVDMADSAHWSKVVAERKMAGFSAAEISTLQEMFNHYDEDGSGDIDASEVQGLLSDFGIPCNTREERELAISQMSQARQLAKEAGVERPKKSKTMLTFYELVQLVRLVKTQRAIAQEQRERAMIEKLNFSKQETDDFRSIFICWARNGGVANEVQSSGIGKRVALNEIAAKREEGGNELEEDMDAGLSIGMFHKLLKSLGMTITAAYRTQIELKIAEGIDTNPAGDLTFVGFLQSMRWMLDSNFANINSATKKAVTAAQEEHFAKALR